VTPMRSHMAAAHEQFPPEALLAQAVAAERAGFDGLSCSDHFQPWWEPGESGHAWTWLGAAGALTERVALGTAVTAPVHRYHPALVAQFIATLERMNPGRAFLGLGSGESLNETPLGMDWPGTAEQLDRLEEALEIIDRLLAGERLTRDGRFAMREAVLHTRPERRPPIYVSAFHPGAAELAGRRGDGLWTMADPEMAPAMIEAYRAGADDAGREPGEILLHASFSWAPDDETALRGASAWRATLVPDYFTDDWHDPVAMQERARREISDERVRSSFIVSSDPEAHAERIREVERLGATIVVLMNISGEAPVEAVEVYGREVLPRLRGGHGEAARRGTRAASA